MATYSPDTRNAIAAAIASLLSGSRLFLLSATGTILAIVPTPPIRSPETGTIEAGPFAVGDVVGSGEPVRYEFRQASGLAVMSGFGSELRIDPPLLVAGGRVFIDSFVLTV